MTVAGEGREWVLVYHARKGRGKGVAGRTGRMWYAQPDMPTFIDESGDTGHKRNSKPYFRVGAVYLPSPAATDAFRAAVRRVRVDLGVRADYEFKYARTHHHPDRRAAFFDTALAHGLRFVVCCVDKTAGPWRSAFKADFYYATTMYLAATLRPVYRQAESADGRRLTEPVLVDDCEDPKYLEAVQYAFRGLPSGIEPGVSIVGRPRYGDSAGDEVLQLADMVCGAVGDRLEENGKWYDHIRAAGLGVDCGWGLGVSVLS